MISFKFNHHPKISPPNTKTVADLASALGAREDTNMQPTINPGGCREQNGKPGRLKGERWLQMGREGCGRDGQHPSKVSRESLPQKTFLGVGGQMTGWEPGDRVITDTRHKACLFSASH